MMTLGCGRLERDGAAGPPGPTRSALPRLGALVLVGLSFVSMVGCGPPAKGRPMPGDKVDLEIKGAKVRVEVASDDLSRTNGLMYRERLAEDEGMLFVYSSLRELSFWMRNTLIPLSIAFLDDSGKILEIRDMQPKDESRTVSMYKVRYALEVNQGWFQRHGVHTGDAFVGFAEKVRAYQER